MSEALNSKLGGYIRKINQRFSDLKAPEQLAVFGVTNKEGVVNTGVPPSDDLSNYIVVGEGQFVYNPYRVNVGSIGLTPKGFKGLVSPAYVVFETKDELDPEYLFLYLKSERGINLVNHYGNRGGVRDALRYDALIEIDFPFVDRPIQKNIVARLQSLQSLHREADALLARLQADVKRLRQSILQEAIQGKLVPNSPPLEGSGEALLADIRAEKERRAREAGKKPEAPLPPVTPEEMPFELPEGWLWCRLGEVLDIVSGVQKGKAYNVNTFEVPYLRVANVQRGWLDLNEIKTIPVSQEDFERLLLKKRDILMTEGGDPDKLGRCAIWNEEVETCIHQNHIFRGRIILQEQNEFYLMALLNSPYAIKYFLRKFKQMTNLASVSKSDLSNLHIPLPPISIQNLILKDLEKRSAQLTQLDQQLTALQAKTERLWKSELQQTFKFENVG
ncbi:MAG: hypothetical protein EPGJADBJ_03053 [Saprospiraceae bacterium]|nr:hypothetical protein [Saprospiraceae bacterium]